MYSSDDHNHPLDKLARKQADQFAPTPPPELWDSIQAALPDDDKRRPLGWLLIPAFLLILSAGFSMKAYFGFSDKKSEATSAESATKSKRTKTSRVAASQNVAAPEAIPDVEATSNVGSNSTDSKSQASPSTLATASEINQPNHSKKSLNKPSTLSSNSIKKSIRKTSTSTPKRINSAYSRTAKSSISQASTVSSESPSTAVSFNNAMLKLSSSKNLNYPASEDLFGKMAKARLFGAKSSVVEEEFSGFEQLEFRKTAIKLPTNYRKIVDTVFYMKRIVAQQKKVKMKDLMNPKKGLLLCEISFQPEYINSREKLRPTYLVAQGNTDVRVASDPNFSAALLNLSHNVGFSGTFSLRYKYNDQFTFGLGIGLLNRSENQRYFSNFSKQNGETINHYKPLAGYEVTELSFTNTFKMLEFPLLVCYQPRRFANEFGAIRFNVGMAPVYLSNSTAMLFDFQNDRYFDPFRVNRDFERRMGLNALLSTSYFFKLNSKNGIELGLQWRGNLVSMYNEHYPVEKRLNTFGARIAYQFR